MNALTSHDFALVSQPVAEWLVLRCSPGRTLALAAALRSRGAWTPTWTRRRRLPRSPVTRPITEPCIPTFVFIPSTNAHDLPPPGAAHIETVGDEETRSIIPAYGLMRFEGALIRIADRELNHLRKIADKPAVPASQLPRTGRSYRIVGLGFDGLLGRVIRCTSTKCFVDVDGFAQPLQIPPSLLQENR